MKLRKPHQLAIGDKIAIVSLSSGILGEPFCSHQVALGVKRLAELGLQPVFMPNALKDVEFIKNNPGARAKDLKMAYEDESIKAIICAIGGDDTYKILPYLFEDTQFVAAVKANPKIFLGFSDSTNNHFMFAKLGVVSYYGLNFLGDLAELEEAMLPYTKQSFLRLFTNPSETYIHASKLWYEERRDFSQASLNTLRIAYEQRRGYEVLRGSGKVRGQLFGGCLESIYSMLTGDRYPDQKVMYEKYKIVPSKEEMQGNILFLETSEQKVSGEQFATMIDTLIEHGMLSHARALIFGKPQDEHNYELYNEILLAKTKAFALPILSNVNFGHALPHALIPYGLVAEIDFEKQTFKIIEKYFK